MRDLEEFLAGEGVEPPRAGEAAAAGGAIAALIGAWVVNQLLSGARVEDVLQAIKAWRRGGEVPPAVEEVPSQIPEEAKAEVPGGRPKPTPALKSLASAILQATAAALERRLGRPPTPDEIAAEIAAGRLPPCKEILDEMKKLGEESGGPKGWGAETADWADRWLNKILPPTIPIYGPGGKVVAQVPNPNLVTHAARVMLSGLADTLRLGEGFAQAVQRMEALADRRNVTMGEAAWEWSKSCWDVIGEAFRATTIAKNVSSLGRGIANALSPKPGDVPVIKGPVPSMEPMPPGGTAVSPTAAGEAIRIGMGGQRNPYTCTEAVTARLLNKVYGGRFTEGQAMFHQYHASRDAPVAGVDFENWVQRLKDWGMQVRGQMGLDVFSEAPVDFKAHLARPNSAIGVVVRVSGGHHALEVLDVVGQGHYDAVVRVFDPARGGVIRTTMWSNLFKKLAGIVYVSR